MPTTQPQLYLVPCSCGEKLRVRGGQAGEKLTCKCGQSVPVPTIRQLRQLETVADESAPRPSSALSAWQGPLFSIGAILLFVGLILIAYTQLFSVLPPDEMLRRFEADIERQSVPVDQLGMDGLYEEFKMLREQGTTTSLDQPLETARAASAGHKTRQFLGTSLAGVGGLMLVLGLTLSLTSPQRR
ncbi:hypothetical protein NA78x_000840 [Anatilimnocola sp. NA78]|uniref:hypothetical protein n=1 Tax=Anatilimnocola sp. NA78 TaxID=3415683 RepID=UPI003CE4AE49